MLWNRFVSARSVSEVEALPSSAPSSSNLHVADGSTSLEGTPLLSTQLRTYKRRWWILFVFSLASFMQSTLWNGWGPISYAAESALDWEDWNVATIPNVSNMGTILTGFFMQYVVDRKGLRTSMLVATGCLFLGSGLWCIAVNIGGTHGYVVILIGAILNGMSSTIYVGAPSLLSNLWFAPNQRSTATGFSASAGYFGSSIAFLTGPFISGAGNITGVSHNLTVDEKANLRHGILNLMYFDFGLCALSAALVIAYFPSMPTLPPSLSAQAQRMRFSEGVKHVLKSSSFWRLNLAFNIPNGVYNAWLTVLPITLQALNITESECGWIGFYSMVGGCLTAVVMARFTDIFRKKMKIFLLAMTCGALASFVVLLLMVNNYMRFIKALLYVVNIIGGCLINGAIPLYYELACETTYPAQEGIVGACISIFNNFVGVLFYIIFLFPITGSGWTSWAMVGVLVASVACLISVKEHYRRLDMDMSQSQSVQR